MVENVDRTSKTVNWRDVVTEMGERFTSSNSIPVERATIRRHEWDAILQKLADSLPVETTARIAVDGDVMPWGWRPRPICRAAPFRNADPPQDCDAPFCGCVPAWDDAIAMLQECGWKSPQELRAEEHEHRWIDGADPEQQVCLTCDSTRMTPAEPRETTERLPNLVDRLKRINAINDDPSRYNPEIDKLTECGKFIASDEYCEFLIGHEGRCGLLPGNVRPAVEPKPPHITEDDFQHWLSYSGVGAASDADLRAAYYAGANAAPPAKASGEQS